MTRETPIRPANLVIIGFILCLPSTSTASTNHLTAVLLPLPNTRLSIVQSRSPPDELIATTDTSASLPTSPTDFNEKRASELRYGVHHSLIPPINRGLWHGALGFQTGLLFIHHTHDQRSIRRSKTVRTFSLASCVVLLIFPVEVCDSEVSITAPWI
jgi:hypothetical protein